MSDDFNLDTHCVVCREPRSTHPTDSNNPYPLYDEGRACRDCDVHVTAARIQTFNEIENGHAVIATIRDFLRFTYAIKRAERVLDGTPRGEEE